jgi:hypothetical protein
MTKAEREQSKPKKVDFRVWFPQVNQTYVDVKATTSDEAFEKAAKKWRREYGHNDGNYIKELGK